MLVTLLAKVWLRQIYDLILGKEQIFSKKINGFVKKCS